MHSIFFKYSSTFLSDSHILFASSISEPLKGSPSFHCFCASRILLTRETNSLNLDFQSTIKFSVGEDTTCFFNVLANSSNILSTSFHIPSLVCAFCFVKSILLLLQNFNSLLDTFQKSFFVGLVIPSKSESFLFITYFAYPHISTPKISRI